MGLRFLAADKITDPASASRILTKYKNREITMFLDSQSFVGTIISVNSENGTLDLEFTWGDDLQKAEHILRLAKSRIGSMVRFKVGSDELTGLLSGITELPQGATIENYLDVPFMFSFAFSAQDQKPIVASEKEYSGIIGITVPKNICDHLPLSDDLEYEPHITVCYLPNIKMSDVENILQVAKRVAHEVGSFSVRVDGCTNFPNPNKEGKYPHVGLIKSEKLKEFHTKFVEEMDFEHPGVVDTKFALKNYKPHLTLDYVDDPGYNSAPKPLAWTVDHLSLRLGNDHEFPILLSLTRKHANGQVHFQLGETEIPFTLLGKQDNTLSIRLQKPEQAEALTNAEGSEASLVSSSSVLEVEFLEVNEVSFDTFEVVLRPLVKTGALTGSLAYVRDILIDRGNTKLADQVERTRKKLEEDEPEDKEALGPGFEGTDHHIVVYTKAPQTQQEVQGPKFPRALALHERI